nr:tetratricopeptide repeat protein [Pyrinomonadaceae bacterium]
KGDVKAASEEFQEAARLNKLKSNRQAAVFAANTGLARLKEGNFDEAIERFQAAVELDPTNAHAYYNLANALQKKGQQEAARAAYQKAKELDPRVKPLPEQ